MDRGYSVGWGHKALQQLASFLSPTRVIAYGSLGGYAAACLHGIEPAASLVMQVDVPQIKVEDARAVAAISLTTGGLCFRLNALDRGRAVANVDCWRRIESPSSAKGPSSIDRARQVIMGMTDAPVSVTERSLLEMINSDSLLTDLALALAITPSGGP